MTASDIMVSTTDEGVMKHRPRPDWETIFYSGEYHFSERPQHDDDHDGHVYSRKVHTFFKAAVISGIIAGLIAGAGLISEQKEVSAIGAFVMTLSAGLFVLWIRAAHDERKTKYN